MAYNYTQSDLTKQAKKELDDLNIRLNSFDQTYDHTKDAGWVAANNQLMSAADIAASNASGRMANRIGATSTAQQVASDSVYANALKNSQNLIGQYKDAAYNKLLNQRNMADQNYWNSNNFDMQKYAQQLAQENADRAYNYQVEQDKKANEIAMEQAKAAQIKAQNEANKQLQDLRNSVVKMNAEWGTNYKVDANGNIVNANGLGTLPIGATTNVAAVDDFLNNIYDKSTFDRNLAGRSGYSDYTSYVNRMLSDWDRAGRLSKDDQKRIKAYYGMPID